MRRSAMGGTIGIDFGGDDLEALGDEALLAHVERRIRPAAKPATSAGPVATKRCSGPPAGTWKTRPAGIVRRRRAVTNVSSPSMTMPQCGWTHGCSSDVPVGAGLGDLGQDVGHRAEHRETDGDATLTDGPKVDGRDMHSDVSSVFDAVVGLGARSIAGSTGEFGRRTDMRLSITRSPRRCRSRGLCSGTRDPGYGHLRRGGLPGPRSATPAAIRETVHDHESGTGTAEPADQPADPSRDRGRGRATIAASPRRSSMPSSTRSSCSTPQRPRRRPQPWRRELLGRDRDKLIGRPLGDLVRPSEAAAGRLHRPDRGRRRHAATVMTEVQPGDRPADLGRGRPPAGVAGRRIAGHRRDRPRHQRPDRGPGPPPAPGPVRARPRGGAERGHPGDGRGRRRVRLGRPRSCWPTRPPRSLFPDVASQTYADVVGLLDDPSGRAPQLGARAGPVELRDRRRPGPLGRARRPTR